MTGKRGVFAPLWNWKANPWRTTTVYRLLLVQRTDAPAVQFFRYSIVGGFAFVADVCILVVLAEAVNRHCLRAATVAVCAGLTVNYLLSIFARRQCIFSRAERS